MSANGWFLAGIAALIIKENPKVRGFLGRVLDALARYQPPPPIPPPPGPKPLPEPSDQSLHPMEKVFGIPPIDHGKATGGDGAEEPIDIEKIIADAANMSSFDLDKLIDGQFRTRITTPEVNATLPASQPPRDLAFARCATHPAVIVIAGHRGTGKTVAAFRYQELCRGNAPPYAIGLPSGAAKLLPDWYGLAADIDEIPPNAIIYVPEAYRIYHARESQSSQGRAIGNLVNLARHRRHTLIFDVQNMAHLDRNIVSEADVFLIKEPGPMTAGFERPQLKSIMDGARAAFASLAPARRKQMVWVVAPAAGIEGQLMDVQLPEFWSDKLSRVFQNSSVESKNRPGTAVVRRGTRTPHEALVAKAKSLRAAGYSYGDISKILGVSRSHAFRLVKS